MDGKKLRVVVAVTGASGSIYARALVDRLLSLGGVTIDLVFSSYGEQVAKYEGEYNRLVEHQDITIHDNNDMFSTLASGSSRVDAVVVIPCSASTMARIATGVSNNLITRVADVMLKERRKLIISLRETPLSLVHIENMRSVTLAGGVVMPLMPSFYSLPTTIEELVQTQVDRVVSLLGVSDPERFVFDS